MGGRFPAKSAACEAVRLPLDRHRSSELFAQPCQSHPLAVIEQDSFSAEFLPQDLVLLLEGRVETWRGGVGGA